MINQEYDVIIIGAGASGLIAALEIALTGRKVAVLEAKEKAGGRINTFFAANGQAIELGAEFVHGDLPITKDLAEKAGAKMLKVSGSIWQKKDGALTEQEEFIEDFSELQQKLEKVTTDISVATFFEKFLASNKYEKLRFTLQNYVEGYYAADITRASTFALREELLNGDDEQYRLEEGYQKLVAYLEQECKNHGVEVYFSSPVLQLHWKKDMIDAITPTGSFNARKAIITVSIGVLQKEGIQFSPALPDKKIAAAQLGYGHVIKINLLFEEPFWANKAMTGKKDLHDVNFLFSEETIPTWWTQHPKNSSLLIGWLGGPMAKALQTLPEEELMKKAIHSLGEIFGIDVTRLNQLLTEAKMYNWSADDHFNGAYSYEVINGERLIKEVLKPVEKTIYFAGEGLHSGKEIGTVEAALQSGRSVAQELISKFE